MIIHDKFTLLKDIPNVLHLSDSILRANSVKDSHESVQVIMKIMRSRITHFTTKRVFQVVKSGNFNVVYIPKYPLPVSYNVPTKTIVVNLSSFGTRDVTPTNPNPRDLYSCFAYGVCFSDLVSGRKNIPDKFSGIISSYLMTVMFRIFGKEYGLLGYYSVQIPRLKFLIACYVNDSFFGIKGNQNFKLAGTISGFNYQSVSEDLSKFDFSKIDDFITSLSELKVFPGMSKYSFTSKILRMLTINFIPAFEDCARFISILTTSNIPGVTFIPSSIYRYNEVEFEKILQISQNIFK